MASKLAIQVESNPGILAAHTLQRLADQLSTKVVGGIGGRWTALPRPPRTCTKSCNPKTLVSVPGTFASSRLSPRSWTSWRRVNSVEQRMSPRSVSKPQRWPCRRRLEACITRELRHDMRLRKFLGEGRAPGGRACKGQEKGKHSDKGKGRPHLMGQSKGKSSDKDKAFEEKASPA